MFESRGKAMGRNVIVGCLAVGMLWLSERTTAATISVEVEVDIRNALETPTSVAQDSPLSVLVTASDVLEITYKFRDPGTGNAQFLEVTDLDGTFVIDESLRFTSANGHPDFLGVPSTLSVLGVQGAPNIGPVNVTCQTILSALGAGCSAAQFPGVSPLIFDTFRHTWDFQALAASGLISVNAGRWVILADSFRVISSSTPEPAAAVLLVIGILTLGTQAWVRDKVCGHGVGLRAMA